MITSNDADAVHLGGGVVLFKEAISADWKNLVRISEEIVNKDHSEMYKEAIDQETGLPAYVNKSGYIFDKDGVDRMPKRGSTVHLDTRQEVKEAFISIEAIKDQYLLKYMYMFPTAYKNVWWKVKGHIVCYSAENGNYIGKHSDTSADYAYGFDHPADQLATRNTISCLVYFGSCSHHGDNASFSGGHHYFNYLDIDYCPSSGDILMFPSNYMATHEVKPVSSGVRYSYLGWYCHGTPNKNVNEDVIDPILSPDGAQISTNVYMPSLRADFEKFILSQPDGTSSDAYSLVRSINGNHRS